MIRFPNAKINLGLHVTEKRPDGFHNIESIFYPLPLYDILEIIPAKTFSFHVYGEIKIPQDQNNILVKAYHLLKEIFSLPPVNIILIKYIPTESGLGGGSSNAAYTLMMLNEMFDLRIQEKQMLQLADTLGKDCPFFLKNKAAYVQGTGNIFSPANITLKNHKILLVFPSFRISTGKAFQNIIIRKKKKNIPLIIKENKEIWKKELLNDFENYVHSMHPSLEKIKENLYAKGALYASMSGSGSCIYAIFDPAYPEEHLHLPDHNTWHGILE
jgi:4-diphosphocytidyl-2-C-methyl-D-erythritol kinase